MRLDIAHMNLGSFGHSQMSAPQHVLCMLCACISIPTSQVPHGIEQHLKRLTDLQAMPRVTLGMTPMNVHCCLHTVLLSTSEQGSPACRQCVKEGMITSDHIIQNL